MSPQPDVTTLNIPGLDTERGLIHMNGNHSLYLTILASFVEDYSDAGARITTGFAQGDAESVELLVHSIKGLSGIMGALDVQAASTQLDTALKAVLADEMTAEEAAAEIPRFTAVLDDFVTALRDAGVEGGDRGDSQQPDVGSLSEAAGETESVEA